MTEYWRQHPPTHIIMAAHAGFKPPKEPVAIKPSEDPQGDGMAGLIGMFGNPEPYRAPCRMMD